MRDLLLEHDPLADRRQVVGRGPVLGHALDVDIELPGLECLQQDHLVTEVLIGDLAEVVAPHTGRDRGAPAVRDAFVGDVAVRLEGLDAVRAAAEGGFEGGGSEIARLPVVLGQDRDLADDQGQLTVRLIGTEGELHPPLPELLHGRDALVVELEGRVPLLQHGVEGEDDIVGGDRGAIVPARRGAQVEADPGTVRRDVHGFGQPPIGGEGLVGSVRQQRVIEQLQPVGGIAAQDEAVERVVAPAGAEAHRAPLGRVRLDILKVGDVGRVLQVAVHGHTVPMVERACRGFGTPEAEGQPHADGNPADPPVLSHHRALLEMPGP